MKTISNYKIFIMPMRQVRALCFKLIVGSSIGICQYLNVVVDTSVGTAYKAQLRRQKWVIIIECISAISDKIPPYVIFKGEHLISTWLPNELPPGWTFTTNTSGWMNNFHGVHWVKHFNTLTANKLKSAEEYHLLLCNRHDISGTNQLLHQLSYRFNSSPISFITFTTTSRCRCICSSQKSTLHSSISSFLKRTMKD